MVWWQFRDITERYSLDQQIIENEKLSTIERLGSGLAHEIRNPLTPIMGFVELLKTYNHDDNYQFYIKIITEELQRVKHLVDDFVLISKPEAPLRKITDIVNLINQSISIIKSRKSLKNIQIEVVNRLEKIREINIDSNQINKVLINLIQNALDVTPDGEKIIVQASSFQDGILISVKDQELGISDEEKKLLFSPFFSTKMMELA
ncbi:HAMP domain-containing histidine kinase [Anaerobacillus sp. HL2]|nr:HAMP domain-containing histidine kinase [Anaerobacillus sp. HL2]